MNDGNCSKTEIDAKRGVCRVLSCVINSTCICEEDIRGLHNCLDFPISYSVKCECNCISMAAILGLVIIIEIIVIVLIVYRNLRFNSFYVI